MRVSQKSIHTHFGLALVNAPTTKAVGSECVIIDRTDGFSRRTVKSRLLIQPPRG